MAYNLPPPWDAGYALPTNVKDEGLERRAFITKMMPRGTYDAPKVGSGGYALPVYVQKEPIGQGTFVTKWMPRGTQPNVPHYLDRRPQVLKQTSIGPTAVDVEFAALSGTELPASYQRYGARAAQAILSRVWALPPAQQKGSLKATLDAIDPTLWQRTAAAMARAQARGLAPRNALAAGLAETMTTGVAREVVQIGRRRSAPQPHSLLGLGCYGRTRVVGAMGALGAVTNAINMVGTAVAQLSQQSGPQPSTNGTCPAGQTGYNWIATAGNVPAHWERARAGQGAQFCGSIAPSGPPGGVTVSDTHEAVLVGPIQLPINATRASQVVFSTPADLTPEIAAWVKTTWEGKSPPSGAVAPGTPNNPWDSPQTATWLQAVGFTPGQAVRSTNVAGFPTQYLLAYKFVHPVTNAEWYMRVGLTNTNIAGKTMDPAKPVQLSVWAGPPQDRGLLSKALSLTAKVARPLAVYGGGVIASALDVVQDLTCELVTNPNAVATGAAVGVAVGAGASVGAAGAAIASQFCSSPTPPPMPEGEGSSILPLAIAGGVVAIAAVVLSKKKKAP